MEAARNAGNRLRAQEFLAELGTVLEDMVQVDAQADKIVRFLAERRKQADSETRRMISERLVFSLEEAQMFYSALGAAVNRNVSNEEERRAILSEIASVAGERPGSAHIG
jgi:hypothetical protein